MLMLTLDVRPTTFACWTRWLGPCTRRPFSALTELSSSSRFSTVIGGKCKTCIGRCCTKNLLRVRYNVDCSVSESYYGLAEGAFGTDADGANGGGQCPNAQALSDSQCQGVFSNCWSPGQSDVDCPNFGLCCFDGCANRCVDGPESMCETVVYVLSRVMRYSVVYVIKHFLQDLQLRATVITERFHLCLIFLC